MLLCSVHYAAVSETSEGTHVLQSWQAVLRMWYNLPTDLFWSWPVMLLELCKF